MGFRDSNMTIQEMSDNAQNTKDNIGARDSTRNPILKRNSELIQLEENSTIISTNTIGNSFILGHSVNGVLGTANGMNGSQIQLGEQGRTLTVVRIVNPNNTFREHFRDTVFRDGTSVNTADWNTTLYRLAMTTDTDQTTVYNTIATLSSIFYNEVTVSKVLINAKETKHGNDIIRYMVSADGGSNWQEITKATDTLLENPGQDLRIQVIFMGSGANETYLENLQVKYS